MTVTENTVQGIKRRDEILRYLLSFSPAQWPPSVREIGEAVGLSSPSTVLKHLAVLERDGWISRGPGHRQIRLTDKALG